MMRHVGLGLFSIAILGLVGSCGPHDFGADNVCVAAMQHIAACIPGTSTTAQLVCDAKAQEQANQVLQMDCTQIQNEQSRSKTDWINGPFKGCDEPCFQSWGYAFCAPREGLPEHTHQDCCHFNDEYRWRSGRCDQDADAPNDDNPYGDWLPDDGHHDPSGGYDPSGGNDPSDPSGDDDKPRDPSCPWGDC